MYHGRPSIRIALFELLPMRNGGIIQKPKQDDVSPADASDFEDAIDLMVNSDLEMTQ